VPFESQSPSSRRDTVAFIVCLLLAVSARIAPPPLTESIAETLRDTVLKPFLSLQDQTYRWNVRRAEFDFLVAQRDSLLATRGQVDVLRLENTRLRVMLGLRARMPVHHVGAEVLHQTQPTEGITLVLSAGERDGVKRWAPVVAAGGLVGNVQQIESGSSVAVTWTHPEFRVSAIALGGEVVGMVAPVLGSGATMMLELSGVPYGQEVPIGTEVLTAGYGGVYPRGIPIGIVRGVSDQEEGWSRSYLVEPAVHPASVSHVLILLADANDLERAFQR